jgi:very-short-patch-repair endonuclease
MLRVAGPFSPKERRKMTESAFLPLSSGEKGPIAKQWEERPLFRDGFRQFFRLMHMNKISLAKHLRSNMTSAERNLWYRLRAKRLNGFKFYRQVPIGPYIVDFVNHEFGLVIELDGATHSDSPALKYDAARTEFLQVHGYQVIRTWNHEVFENISGVCDRIVFTLEAIKAEQQK